MTAATPELALRPGRAACVRAGADGGGESAESTLEDLILGAWEDLSARGCARCPVCAGGELTPAGCPSCGSVLCW